MIITINLFHFYSKNVKRLVRRGAVTADKKEQTLAFRSEIATLEKGLEDCNGDNVSLSLFYAL